MVSNVCCCSISISIHEQTFLGSKGTYKQKTIQMLLLLLHNLKNYLASNYVAVIESLPFVLHKGFEKAVGDLAYSHDKWYYIHLSSY